MAEAKKTENRPTYSTYQTSKPELRFPKNFFRWLWNGETKELCGRSFKRWFYCLIFYIVFYMMLGGFFYLNFFCFTKTLNDQTPYWQLEESVISTSPGLSFRPKPPENNIDSLLLWIVPGPQGDASYWSKQITNFLNGYDKSSNSSECSANNSSNESCVSSTESLGPICNSANQFGYAAGTPCVIIKINKIFGWKPELYTQGSLPDELVKLLPKDFSGKDMIYLTCSGETKGEQENMGELDFFPAPGFPSHYFPYTNQPGYQSPLVAIYFKNATRGVPIGVECRAWAKNIDYNRQKKIGCVSFDLLIEI